jgi:hypothetical protein
MRSYPELSNSFADQNESSQLSDGFRPEFEGVSDWFNHTVKAIAHALLGNLNPFIWLKTDRNSNTWWIIDEALTGIRFPAVSEEEVRAWIEQHHYAQPKSFGSASSQVNPLLIERW